MRRDRVSQIELARNVTNIHHRLKTAREPYEPVWDEILDFINPRRKIKEDMKTSRGKKRGLKIFDSAGRRALDVWTNGFQGWMTSRATTWFRFKTEKAEYNDKHEIRQWLQDLEEEFYAQFNRSNFYDAIATMYSDGGSVATATWTIDFDQRQQRLVFQPQHPADIWIATDRFGRPNTWNHRYWIQARELVRQYPKQLGDDFTQIDERAKLDPYYPYEVIHLVRPREERDLFKIDSKNMPWESVHLLVSGQKILREGGFIMPRLVTWRTRVEPGEDYGRGPGWDALAEVKRVQQVARGRIRAAQFGSDPIVGIPNGIKLDVEPGERFDFGRPNMLPTRVDLGGAYGISLEEEMQIRNQIDDMFHTRFFLLMSDMADKEYTATQVNEMQGERAAVMGAQAGRIGSELLDHSFELTFHVLNEEGKIPPPPEEILEAGDIVPEYVGPMMQAQQRYYKTVGVQASLNQLIPYAELRPEILDVVDWDKMARHLLEAGNLPQDLLLREEELRQRRAAAAAAAQEERDMAMMQSGADSYQKLNSRPESQPAVGIGEQLRRSLGG